VSSQREPRIFGAGDAPECPDCSKPMRLTRRGPRVDHGGYYEFRIFMCRACDHKIERSINTDGTPHGSLQVA
jgi:hypothetical protein